jgi:hypothetical protein
MPDHLPNNRHAHSSRNVFAPQSQHNQQATTLRGVGQDKPRPPSARTASPQPAPLPKVMRPHTMNSNSARSQKRSTPKRKTVHLTLWVKPTVKAELQRRAEREGVSVSATGAAFLEKAMQADIDMQYGAMLKPIIERTINKHLRSRDNRLAFLLARAAYESGMTKGLALYILKQAGVGQERLKAMLDESSRKARTTLLRRTPQLEMVLSEVAAWLEETDQRVW